MRPIDFWEEAKRLFPDKMYDTLSGFYLTAINSAISKVASDIKAGNVIYEKEIDEGVRFVEVGEKILDIMYAYLEKDDKGYLLKKTTLSYIDLDMNRKGRPQYYAFTNTSTPFANIPLPCVIFDCYTDDKYNLVYMCKEEPDDVKGMYDEIKLPIWTKQAIKFYTFYMLCQFFRDPRITFFLQLYEKEIEEKNDKYYEETPLTGVRPKKIIFITDNPAI